MIDVGFVLYKKGSEAGTLEANWCHSSSGAGTGKASGGPDKGFSGNYSIRYFDNNGNIEADLELDIEKDGNIYQVIWIQDGKITARGIGMEVDEGLAVGWRSVD